MEKYEKNQELIEKIIGILGYDAYDAFIKSFFDSKRKMIDFKNDNERQIKNQVMQSNRLSLQQKALLNNVLCKNLNSFMKQLEILNIALDNMDENANGENLDDEWILDFFDKSTRIKSESTKIVWGKMLANAASDKRICSKILLNSLFLMGSEEISDFLNVCRFCFSEMSAGKNKEEISSYPVIFFNKKGEDYKKEKISILSLHKLQMLGLIETDFNNEYLFDKKI